MAQESCLRASPYCHHLAETGELVRGFSLEADALVLSSGTQELFFHCQGLCLLAAYSRISALELPLTEEGASPRITTPPWGRRESNDWST